MKLSNTSLTACGSGVSSNLNMAMSRAIDAKRQLADTINGEISSNMDDCQNLRVQ